MKSEKLITLIYLSISVLSFGCILVTTATIDDILWGLTYLWICYLFFYLFNKRIIAIKGFVGEREIHEYRIKHIFISSCLCVVGVVFAVRFYTGNMPSAVLSNLKSGVSLYQSYQNYFANNGLGILQWVKIPAIVANIFVEFIFIYSYINTIILDNKKHKEVLIMVIATLSKIYFGVARGTNFEMFEIAFLAIYCFWTRKASQTQKIRRILLMVLGVVACVFIFDFVIAMRGNHGNYVWISQEIYTDYESGIVEKYPVLSKLIARLGSYFSFGTFVTSYYFTNYFADSIYNFITGIIPIGNMASMSSLPSTAETAHLKSVCWTPDLYVVIKYIGVIGGPFVYGLLGNIYRRLKTLSENHKSDIFFEMAKYFVIYELFSLPIGDFIWVSSATRMTFLITVFVIFIRGKIRIGSSVIRNANIYTKNTTEI